MIHFGAKFIIVLIKVYYWRYIYDRSELFEHKRTRNYLGQNKRIGLKISK